MNIAAILILTVWLVACSREPVEWEHGWKTKHAVATRYYNPTIGYHVGFMYPLNPSDCDRIELFDFMASHGGHVFQAGGYSGAEMFVIFDDARDREGANRKLQSILPRLEALVSRFR